jgi:hypothetical protein
MLALLSQGNIVLTLVFNHVLRESLGPPFGINGRYEIVLKCLVATTQMGLFAILYLPVFLLARRKSVGIRSLVVCISAVLFLVLIIACHAVLITDFAVL